MSFKSLCRPIIDWGQVINKKVKERRKKKKKKYNRKWLLRRKDLSANNVRCAGMLNSFLKRWKFVK
jgi:uncharacterized protein YijF (DUF1287 family)